MAERINREKHDKLMEILDHMHYFQYQVRERVVVVWWGQNYLAEKVEKLENWMAHFKGHIQCNFRPPPPPGTAPNNPAFVTSDNQYVQWFYLCFVCLLECMALSFVDIVIGISFVFLPPPMDFD